MKKFLDNIKIALVTHKPYNKFENSCFLPIHAGRAIAKTTSKDGMINNEDYEWLLKNTTGDDTGDNISYKNRTYCELTALYWLWKNQKAEYMGMCHYRRYLSFNNYLKENFAKEERNNGCYTTNYITPSTIKKYGLDENSIRNGIYGYDAIFVKPINLTETKLKSNYEAMAAAPDYHIMKDVDNMIEIIRRDYPQMNSAVEKYMHNTKYNYLYNCFVMRYDLFNEYCSWLFDILEKIEQVTDLSHYSIKQMRVFGLLAERMTGIWNMWLKEQKKYKVKEVPLLFVEYPDMKSDIKPFFSSRNIAVTSNFNDNYAPIFDIFLKSAIEHSSEKYNYDFIVLGDISKNNMEHLMLNVKDVKNVSLRFYNPAYLLSEIPLFVNQTCYSTDLYYRVIIPWILKNYEKILVVDADTVCREDLANLYNEDISGYLAGGIKDTVYMGQINGMEPYSRVEYTQNYMNMDDPYKYINTGILLFDCSNYRNKYSLDYLKNFISMHIGKVLVYEQDMLNMLLYKNIKFLDAKWNIYTQTNNWVVNMIKGAPLKDFETYCSARKQDGGIIHYANSPKPWTAPMSDFADLWWKYARTSSYYEKFVSELYSIPDTVNSSMLNDLINWRKNCFQYWKYKLLRNFVSGKTKDRYIKKKYLYKNKIHNAEQFIRQR